MRPAIVGGIGWHRFFSPQRTPRTTKDAQRAFSDDEALQTILQPGRVEIHQ
jgi:hypothetical protein